MKKKSTLNFLPKKIKFKYEVGDKVPSSGIYECSNCSNYQAFKKSEIFPACEDCLNSGKKNNQWYATNIFLHFISKNLNIEFDKFASFQIKIADKITEWAGSLWFVYFHTLWFLIWILANLGYFGQKYIFDPYPFGLLTMIVSLEAIFLSTFIMISQNISAQKSEMRAEHEYQINLQTEKNVAEILTILKEIRKDSEEKTDVIEEIKDSISEIVEDKETQTKTLKKKRTRNIKQ